MTPAERAQFVCHTCRAGKRACDKALPACGGCVKRGLSCTYNGPAKKPKDFRPYNPGKHFVAMGTLKQESVVTLSKPSSLSSALSDSIHESLHILVQDVLILTNLTTDDVTSRYFQSFHRLYPIISPEVFQQMASKHSQGGGTIDYSILILAMLLAITLPGHHRATALSLLDQEQLYVKIKPLLAQIQTATPPSIALVQALFIVTTWEYTRARPEAAYSSINSCSSLARILGIGNELFEKAESDQATDLVEMERKNLAWATAMLERIILAEMGHKTIRPLLAFPNLNCQLPLDLLPLDSTRSTAIDYQISMSATLSCFEAGNVSWFGRQAQAVFLLDRVLDAVCTASKNNYIQDLLAEAIELDHTIRNFLAVLLEESLQKSTTLCSAVAFSIRALFLLHWSILDALPASGNDQAMNLSWTAINSACNMAIDAIMYAEHDPATPVPICSYYILQHAIRYLSEHQKVAGEEASVSDQSVLLRADREYRDTYIF